MIERGWIRNATIIKAERRESPRGDGYIVCRTNLTGHLWIYMPRTYYLAIVSRLDAMTPLLQQSTRVCEWLHGKGADVGIVHALNDDTNDGALKHTWDARIHPQITPGLGDYRLGEGGHG